ncbi:MAG: tRNA guanosine(15) transglycosylase TgtA [Candidatus Hermodarchaeota archaeon]
MFEIKQKDAMGRIGRLKTAHGTITTPTLMPVVNPNQMLLESEEIRQTGAEILITNAYILWKKYQDAPDTFSTVHKMINFDGPIMTDSGAFQLMVYGNIDVSNSEITKFQENILQSDIGTFLDIPVASGTKEVYQKALSQTLERADEHIACRSEKSSSLWVGSIQGGPHPDLISESAKKMGSKPFELHAIGSVVPLLEKYQFTAVIEMILAAKQFLPINRPVHLFGAGHPMFFAPTVLLGIDLFDSAAYALFAKAEKYLTVSGTVSLTELDYLPCSCPVCLNNDAESLQKMPSEEKHRSLALHNLYVSFEEIKRIKQAIKQGRLFNLVIERMHSHPSLSRLIPSIFNPHWVRSLLEKFEPATKRKALLLTHPALSLQPLILRYQTQLFERFMVWADQLCIISANKPVPSMPEIQVLRYSPDFGLIPDELKYNYPLFQHISKEPFDSCSKYIANFIEQFLNKFIPNYQQIFIDKQLLTLQKHISALQNTGILETIPKGNENYENFRIKAMIDFQFGKGASKSLENLKFERSKKTNVPRKIINSQNEILANLRAYDFFIVPTLQLGHVLHQNLPFPQMQVIAEPEAVPFIKEGKTFFAKFVRSVDPQIRAEDEVLVTDINNELIGLGKAMLGSNEMLAFNTGIAVRMRTGIK